MSTNNPIYCVNMDIHESFMSLWVHRKNGLNEYKITWHKGSPNKAEQVERMLKFQSKFALRTLHEIDRRMGKLTR